MVSSDVSVIIATRNRFDLLERALASVSRQSSAPREVLIVDDGSTDETRRRYPDLLRTAGPHVRLLQPVGAGEAGSGPAVSRNRGIAAARGRYVAFLDDDDEWIWPEYLRTAVAALSESPSGFFCADIEGCRGAAVTIPSWFESCQDDFTGSRLHIDPVVRKVARPRFLAGVLKRTPHPDALVVDRQLAQDCGGFPRDVWFGEDLGFVLRVLDHTTEVLFCPIVCTRYRLPDGDSVSLQSKHFDNALELLAVAQRVRLSAGTPDVRMTARRIEAWSLSQLSQVPGSRGTRLEAIGLALQALAVYPTAGGLVRLLRTMIAPSRSYIR